LRSAGARVAAALLLAALAFAVFSPALDNGFVNFDDDAYLGAESRVPGGLTPAGVRWAFTTGHMGSWHPLTWLSHMLDVELFGMNPRGHHAVSLALHAANAALLFALLLALTGAPGRALFAAALFAVHPLRVESVAWAAERKDVLAGLFWLLACLAFVRWARRPRGASATLVAVLLAAGLMAKPSLVALPPVLLVLAWWPLGALGAGPGRRGARAALAAAAPLLALAAAAAAATLALQGEAGAIRSLGRFALPARLENAAVSAVRYLGDLAWPAGLAPFYPFPEAGLPAWQWGGALALLAGATAGALALRRRAPFALAGWLWYLAALAPVAGIVQVGGQARADRYTYLSQIGVAIALSWGGGALVARLAAGPRRAAVRTVAAAAAAAWIVALSIAGWRQTRSWRDSETLFTRVIAVTEPHWLPHDNLGQALFAAGRLGEAEAVYRRGLAIAPGSPELHVDLGITLARRGRVPEALVQFQEAAAADPSFAKARLNLGLALGWLGRRAEALAQLREAARLDPRSADAALALGVALELWGAPEEAARHLAAARAIDPGADARRGGFAGVLRGPR
jgi:tetratricopeptide (TPR) repeat protein